MCFANYGEKKVTKLWEALLKTEEKTKKPNLENLKILYKLINENAENLVSASKGFKAKFSFCFDALITTLEIWMVSLS
jgi:hypothetical protein